MGVTNGVGNYFQGQGGKSREETLRRLKDESFRLGVISMYYYWFVILFFVFSFRFLSFFSFFFSFSSFFFQAMSIESNQ